MKAEDLLHRTVTLVTDAKLPFASRMSWHVVNIQRRRGSSAEVQLTSRVGSTESIPWPKLREWITEGYVSIDV